MIKINLARTQIGNATQGPTLAGMPGGGGGAAAAANSRDLLVKILLAVIFTIGLIIYEKQSLGQLNAERDAVQAKVNDADGQVQAKVKELEGYKDFGTQARELEDKLKILKLLSHLRLREVKTLDFMQSSIPEKVWLKSLDYETEKDDVIHGHFNFKGNAGQTEDLTEFTKRLEDSAYLAEVITIRNQEVTVGSQRTNVVREFEFTAQVEVKN